MTSSAIVEYAARLSGQALSRAYLDEVSAELDANSVSSGEIAKQFERAWQAGKLNGVPRSLSAPRQLDCPFVGWHGERGWFAVLAQNSDGSWVTQKATGERSSLIELDGCECLSLPHAATSTVEKENTSSLVWRAIKRHKSVYLDALLATFIVNLLTLATSIYSMQVYDRVIPNQGFQTLYVLSVGVAITILLELLLKHVRSSALDRAATNIDADLSEWFFRRSIGIRLEARPQMVGTLASQIRGYEFIRVVFSSATLFVLAEVPFALFFILVILLIGGWVVVVPLLLLPLALVTGLIFQRKIIKSTKENQGQANRKAGLLVESLDAAETLKANSADWKLLGRWKRLVAEAAESEDRVKHYSTLSQHVTVALQQVGYIAIIALGAYLVTQSELTMGALIACSIISNRVLSPITQLPAVMIQVVQAKVAAEGLDALISLPNELDDQVHAIVPGSVDSGLSFDQVRFDYGNKDLVALEVPRLVINPGERVGVLGSIGSGKSTLTKLASGLYRPTKGRVFLGRLDMAQVASQVLRERIAYLPQDFRLISGTLRDNLVQGLPDPGDEALLDAARKTGLIGLISTHPKGLFLPITESGGGVSGGQRQLIGLTRMLLAKPSVYILDEPTASMDSGTEATVVAQLSAVAATGATMLISTHKTALLPLVDRLLVVHAGKIIMDGPRDAVIAQLSGPGAPANRLN